MDEVSTQQKVVAEALGTFVLVLFGCGAVVFWGQTAGGPGFVSTTTTIGLTFGLALMVMIYAVGRISGAHFNPAVSLGAALGGRLPWHQVPVYVAAQLAGAILAAAVLFGLAQGFDGFSAEGNMGQNGYGDASAAGYALWAALLLELVLTMVFVWVILAVTDERNEHPALAPLAIGFALAAIHFVAIPATGTSVNPARSIGPAIFAGTDAVTQVWVFVVGPLIGGAIAGWSYRLLFGDVRAPVASFAPAGAVPGYGAPDQYQQQWNEGVAEPPSAPQWTPEQIAAWQAQQAQQVQAQQVQAQPPQAQQAQAQQPGSGWPEGDDGDEHTQVRPPR